MSWVTPKTDWQAVDYLNAADLTRIENNIRYLRDELNRASYQIPVLIHRTWTRDGVPNTGDIRRICDNIKVIADHYYRPPQYERLLLIPSKEALDNQDANDLEEFLRWIHHEFRVLGRIHNRHQALTRFTHAQLRQFTHNQIRREGLNNV